MSRVGRGTLSEDVDTASGVCRDVTCGKKPVKCSKLATVCTLSGNTFEV
jgi:hypothetical protein